MEAGVSNEAVAEHLSRVQRLARRFNGVAGAEYDDLVQEGLLKVFLLIRDDQPVSNTAIKNAMRDWVRVCGRRGFAYPVVEEALDTYESAAPGRRKAYWTDDNGSPQVAWGRFVEAG